MSTEQRHVYAHLAGVHEQDLRQDYLLTCSHPFTITIEHAGLAQPLEPQTYASRPCSNCDEHVFLVHVWDNTTATVKCEHEAYALTYRQVEEVAG